MKKIKLLTTGLVASLATVAPLLTITSCNKGGGQDPTKPGIEIKTNPNIKIECDTLEVGKELTLKYTLDNNYGFDVINSTITFSDSNGAISLLLCDINRAKQTITVPAEYVTGSKVTIDIKSESTSSAEVSQAEYTAAIAKLDTASTSRKFTMQASCDMYEIDGEQLTSAFYQTINLVANGLKDHTKVEMTQDETTKVFDQWSENDSVIGFWKYFTEEESGDIYRVPENRSDSAELMRKQFNEIGRTILPEYFDPLYNAYVFRHAEEKNESFACMKFVNKNITYVGGIGAAYSDKTNIVSTHFSFNYDAEDISMPTQYKTFKSPNLIHNESTKFATVSDGITYTFDDNDTWTGRYTIPMNQYTSWNASKPIIIDLNATEKRNFDKLYLDLADGTTPLTSSNYQYDTTTGRITINAGVVTGTQNLILLATPITDGALPSAASITSVKIYQNAE